MAVDKITTTTPKVLFTQSGTATFDGTGHVHLAIGATPAATATFGTHTLVSGTAYQPSTTLPVYIQAYVTHVGKVTWVIKTGSTTKATILNAATVVVGERLAAVLPAGMTVTVTLATSATLGKAFWNSW